MERVRCHVVLSLERGHMNITSVADWSGGGHGSGFSFSVVNCGGVSLADDVVNTSRNQNDSEN